MCYVRVMEGRMAERHLQPGEFISLQGRREIRYEPAERSQDEGNEKSQGSRVTILV